MSDQGDLEDLYGIDQDDYNGRYYDLDIRADDDEDEDYEVDDDDEGEEDDDMGDAELVDEFPITIEPEDHDDGGRVSFHQLAALFQNTTSNQARQNLLAQLLAEPTTDPLPRRESVNNARSALRRTLLGAARGGGERRQRDKKWWNEQKEPHPNGVELLRSGEFGKVGEWGLGKKRPRVGYAHESGVRRFMRRGLVSPNIIPNTPGTVVASYPSIPYVGQYCGEDYGVFYAATQYFTIHLYSTTQAKKQPKRHPLSSATESTRVEVDDDDDEEDTWGNWSAGRRGMAVEDTSMKKIKTVQGEEGRWTITDCDADKKGEKMIYSSITPYVHMLYTAQHDSEHICLDFTGSRRSREEQWGYDSFGIWSIRFSADGKEVVAGAGSGKIMVYDIESQQRSLSVSGHSDDVNAVCFADETSTNILVSGSDDGYVKIWDRRSLSSSTPSGVLVGATEGITYTSPKGDGRYVVVNSKDQAARLYDLRKMRSHSEFTTEPDAVSRYGQPRFDYRNSHYPTPQRLAHPKDCSVMTYRGHAVLRTLIRCHFSPRESTGQQYIYSGSADGKIHIWSLDGRVVQVLDRALSAPLKDRNNQYTDPSAPQLPRVARRDQTEDSYQAYCVRDVSWHGYEPTLMSTCWEMDGGYRRGGTLAKHEWKGLGKGGLRSLEDWNERQVAEQAGLSRGWGLFG
ncbi:hypothetical protein M231_00228 [Tremella mesenterica]|uniref:Uncharacterized protein n=1 Tax=Tremella mesenterica TaxID=5217 RepID=A0A4Q1BWV8_TREME|nr:hypothetical protein M231_00228 [Tremella mesenterica]